MMKIGIMGGTFNPIHTGHLLLARSAMEECQLDKLLLLPSGTSYMKDYEQILPGSLRVELAKLAVKDEPDFYVSDLEVKRGGFSYTADTLLELKRKQPDHAYYFIVGADNLFSIETWKDPQTIFQNCTLIAAMRGDCEKEAILQKKATLEQNYQANIILLKERRFDISSSEIRDRIKAGQSVRYFLPDQVFQFIKDHHLYE